MPALRTPTLAAPEVHGVRDPDELIPGPFLLATIVRDQPRAARWRDHSHAVAELIWVASGVVNVSVGDTIHVIRPGWGLLVPAHATHGSQVMRAARIGTTYLRDSAATQPTTMRLSRALMEMLQHLNDTPMGTDERLRAQQVCLDMIRGSHTHDAGLPVPSDPRISRIARAILADPADDRSLEQWSVITGTSVSTIARTFSESADMSFVRWRRRVRVNAAVSLLAAGASVTAAGRRVGYHSPSAFVTAFRQEVGQTPGAYLKARTAGCADSGTFCPIRDIATS